MPRFATSVPLNPHARFTKHNRHSCLMRYIAPSAQIRFSSPKCFSAHLFALKLRYPKTMAFFFRSGLLDAERNVL